MGLGAWGLGLGGLGVGVGGCLHHARRDPEHLRGWALWLRVKILQGYLAHKILPPLRTLQ